MDRKLSICAILLCSGILYWFYVDSNMDIDYERHYKLVDPVTKTRKLPKEAFNLTKIVKYSDEYINSTNAHQRLYDLMYNLEYSSLFMIGQFYSDEQTLQMSGWPVANQEQCGNQLDWIVTQLEANRNYAELKGRLGRDLTNLMDSYGRPESGLHSGAIHWMGSYELCKKTTLDNDQIRTRYCFARMLPKWWPKDHQTRASIRIGACIPETCDTLSFDLYKSKLETLVKFELPEVYKESLNLESIFCLPDERSPIRKVPMSGRIYLSIVGAWLPLVIVATIAHEVRKKRSVMASIERKGSTPLDQQKSLNSDQSNLFDRVLKVLSLRTSLKTFKTNSFKVKYSERHRVRVDFTHLDFWKLMMAFGVVMLHACYISLMYSRSLSNFLELSTSAASRLAICALRMIDTFFILFGILISYSLIKKSSAKSLSNPIVWIGAHLKILLRVTPIFLLIHWYSKSISPYTGSGPWWDYGVDKESLKGLCLANSWLTSIPYFGFHNQVMSSPTCIIPSWFIVVYTQLGLLVPIITYIIFKLPSHLWRCGFVLLLLTISSLQTMLKLVRQDTIPVEGFSLYGGILFWMPGKFQDTGYFSTLCRLGQVSTGSYFGYLLRNYETGQIDEWPRWIKSNITLLITSMIAIIVGLLPMIGYIMMSLTGNAASLPELVAVNLFIQFLWPILICILVLNGSSVNNHKVVVRFFGHSFWHSFNKLGLCILLVHWEVLYVGCTYSEQGTSYGYFYDIVMLWAFGSFFTIIFSLILYIFVEAPFTSLILLLTSSFGTQSDEISEQYGLTDIQIADKTNGKCNESMESN